MHIRFFMFPHRKTGLHPFILKTGGSRLENNSKISATSHFQVDLHLVVSRPLRDLDQHVLLAGVPVGAGILAHVVTLGLVLFW